MTDAREKTVRDFFKEAPYSQSLNMRLESLGEGCAVVSMPYDPRLVGDPETEAVHGGTVSALLNTCRGVAVMCHPDPRSGSTALTLTIDYMRSARPDRTIVAETRCHHVTRFVAFVQAGATDHEVDSPAAAANGAFTAG